MSIEFMGANAVVLATPPFDPALFSQVWMIERLKITPDEFINPVTIQTPLVFHAPTKRFSLLVIPERIQLNLPAERKSDGEGEGDMVRRIMHEILMRVPQFSSPGAGLNFNWVVKGDGRPNSETTRKLFFAPEKPFFRLFESDDACFGAYASKQFKGIRLRVDAKPVHEPNNERNGTQTIFNFNFNVDTPECNPLQAIERLFGLWEEAKEEASQSMDRISKGCGV
jgi:hypothetical protein